MGARTSEIIQMSFRKRSVVPQSGGSPSNQPAARQTLPQGVRPSPLDGRLTTSTGTVFIARRLIETSSVGTCSLRPQLLKQQLRQFLPSYIPSRLRSPSSIDN